ncbi:FG-GAP repeat domain-containing protein [Aestuariimicrobium ganziense]|uniref:FG-GAP repeat domain-containing protein n=1 Tax=Aestuariimicrobium ganziense TaxID=2773677 RepID=UPI00194349E8|nr:VCBS repeat-containing protein [Aestuariimicrobium ganziense]
MSLELFSRTGRRVAGLAVAAGLALAGAVMSAPSSDALPPQPGQVPHINFGDQNRAVGQVRLSVGNPQQVGDADIHEVYVKVCNTATRALPVGPDTFSWTYRNYSTWLFLPHDGLIRDGLTNTFLASGECAEGSLVASGAQIEQMAFYDLRTNTRIDILPATEWEGIFNVDYARAPGASGVHGDFTGDKLADVNGVVGGNIMTYRSTGPVLVTHGNTGATGYGSISWIGKAGDVDQNAATDLLVRDGSGKMWLQRMQGKNRAGFSTQVGTGFQGVDLMTVIPRESGSWLIGRGADGHLYRYTVTPTWLRQTTRIGHNWQKVTKLFTVGDANGDGIPDLLAVHKDGRLFRYTMTAQGTISSTTAIGHGWGSTLQIAGPGDLDGDGRHDMVAVRSDGKLYFYHHNGRGSFAPARQIGHGWLGVQLIA